MKKNTLILFFETVPKFKESILSFEKISQLFLSKDFFSKRGKILNNINKLT
jgi:hypothetical protein